MDVRVHDHLLPADGTLRGTHFTPSYRTPSYRAGAAQVGWSALREEDSIEVDWPPSWTSLAAVAQSRGLNVGASEAGLAAVTLLRSLGDINAVQWLACRPVIALLYRLAERSGMSWWKKRWAWAHKELLARGVDQAVLDQAAQELGRDDPAIAPSDQGRDLSFAEFHKALDHKEAAEKWMRWAESRHLVVRGTRVDCPHCGSDSWLPMASLPPPVGCPGCGREIEQPYRASDLQFSYRIGEPLRRVLETDSLGHLLVLHWLTQLFDRHGLVGAHPGVTFTDLKTGRDVGEADVLLLFDNGELIPVEVKRRAAGADTRTVALMDALADALRAPWDVLAVTQAARDCPNLEALQRDLPERPRFVLTDDQIHEGHVIWTMGEDPFAWSPRSIEDDRERHVAFIKRIVEFGMERRRDYVSEMLLDRDLD